MRAASHGKGAIGLGLLDSWTWGYDSLFLGITFRAPSQRSQVRICASFSFHHEHHECYVLQRSNEQHHLYPFVYVLWYGLTDFCTHPKASRKPHWRHFTWSFPSRQEPAAARKLFDGCLCLLVVGWVSFAFVLVSSRIFVLIWFSWLWFVGCCVVFLWPFHLLGSNFWAALAAWLCEFETLSHMNDGYGPWVFFGISFADDNLLCHTAPLPQRTSDDCRVLGTRSDSLGLFCWVLVYMFLSHASSFSQIVWAPPEVLATRGHRQPTTTITITYHLLPPSIQLQFWHLQLGSCYYHSFFFFLWQFTWWYAISDVHQLNPIQNLIT